MCYFNPLLIILSGNLRGVLSVIVELLGVPLGGVLLQLFPCPQACQVPLHQAGLPSGDNHCLPSTRAGPSRHVLLQPLDRLGQADEDTSYQDGW